MAVSEYQFGRGVYSFASVRVDVKSFLLQRERFRLFFPFPGGKILVYLDLRRKGHEIYYYLTKERYGVDFLTRDIEGKLSLYQVVWDVNNPETMQREQRALQAAEAELGIKGYLITPVEYLLMK